MQKAANGPDVVRMWSGSGPDVVRKWSGSGPDVVRKWSGSGPDVVREWCWHGLGAFLQKALKKHVTCEQIRKSVKTAGKTSKQEEH